MAEYIEREAAVNICAAQYKECLRKSDWCRNHCVLFFGLYRTSIHDKEKGR